MKPGAFKLWVNWIPLVQPHRYELHIRDEDVVAPLDELGRHGDALGVAVQVDPFESKF